MTRRPYAAPLPRAQSETDQEARRTDPELTSLQAEYPGHWIGRETVVGRGVRYLARACQQDAHPHTVLTDDLSELKAALEAGQRRSGA